MENRRRNAHEGEWHLTRFDAFLFDMDGVITDSMPYHGADKTVRALEELRSLLFGSSP